jgi:hypothetical protein
MNLMAINSSAVSHLRGLPSFGGGFLRFRSVSSNILRVVPQSPREIRPQWYERIHAVPNNCQLI